MLRSLLALAIVISYPERLRAQDQHLSDEIGSAVTAALRYARHDLVRPHKHVSVDRAKDERGPAWSAEQAAAFRTALELDDSAHAGVELCDSRVARCRADDDSQVLSVYTPIAHGDSVTVVIERVETRSSGPPRTRYSLRGIRYTLVRRGAQWQVVRSDLVLVT